MNCTTGCLFNVTSDPTEHEDIAHVHPRITTAMHDRLLELIPTYYTNNDTGISLCPNNVTIPCACWMALNVYGGFLGPFQSD